MHNPFRLLSLLLKARRPSRIDDMVALADGFWLRKGYEALTFFGFIVTHSAAEAKVINGRPSALKNHEMIHLRQAQSTANSWTQFYVRYLWYSLLALAYCRRLKNAAYLLNPFEMEAYDNMYDAHYLDSCREKGTDGWRRFARMRLSERLDYYNKRLR